METTTFQDNLSTTVLSLPNEMTILLFEWACSDVADDKEASKGTVSPLSKEPTEVVISLVCHAWRSMALASSRLWSQYTYRNSKIHGHELDRLAVYLERSRNQSVDLSLTVQSYNSDPSLMPNPLDFGEYLLKKTLDLENRTFSLFHKATEHAHRWRKISLEVQEWEYIGNPNQDILRPLQGLSFPNLECFEISAPRLSNADVETIGYGNSDDGDTYSDRLFNVEGATPKLSCIRMDLSAFAKFMPPLNVTTFELHHKYGCPYNTVCYPLIKLLELLSSPILINLSIIGEMFDSEEDDFLQNGKALTSNLKNFRCSDSSVAGLMWKHLRFPQLETIIFRALTIDELWQYPLDNNTDMFPALRTLALVNCEGPSLESLVSLSQLAGNLTHLFVVEDSDYVEYDPFDLGERSTFARLIEENPNTILWPNLDILTVSRPVDYDPSFEQVKSYIDVVNCRSKHCTLRLPRYNAECWESVNPEAWQALREAGLVQEFAAEAGKSISEWMPWPSRELQGFRRGSADPFFAPSSGDEEEI